MVLSKVSLKVKLISFLKFKLQFFHQYADMSDRNVNPKATYVNYIFNSFFTFDNIHIIQASDAR